MSSGSALFCKFFNNDREIKLVVLHTKNLVKSTKLVTIFHRFFYFFFSKNDREIELVVLHTINPVRSTKWVTIFSWIFYFSLKDFSKKIFEFFSQMPDALGVVCGTMCKVKKKKTFFWRIHSFLPKMLGLK